ncbi:MAG: sensor histidine kinase [Kineosporiaceae bacterium]
MRDDFPVAEGNSQGREDRRHPAGAADPVAFEELRHDLRQPVAAILMLAETAVLESEVPPTARHRLAQISSEARWLAELLQAGGGDDEPARLNMRDLVEDAVAAVAPAFDGTLRVLAADELPVLVPPVSMRRAVVNVLDNAVRAAGPGGEVEVRLANGRDVAVEVHDDGPGFGHVPVRHGIGLRITRRVVDGCGGLLEVDTSHLGGCLVRLRLPAARAVPAEGSRR